MRTLILIVGLLAANTASAAGIDQLKAFWTHTQSAQGSFSQSVISQSGRKPQNSSGHFALARPGKALASKGLSDAGVALRLVAGEGSVGVAGKAADVDRVRTLRLLLPDGSEVPASGLQRGSDGASATLELLLSEPPPADATLVLGLLTKKSVLVVPFELKDVPLP